MKAQEGPDNSEEIENTNYSFQQRSLVIPAYKTNMDSAVLQSSLLAPSKIAKLPPLKKPASLVNDFSANSVEKENVMSDMNGSSSHEPQSVTSVQNNPRLLQNDSAQIAASSLLFDDNENVASTPSSAPQSLAPQNSTSPKDPAFTSPLVPHPPSESRSTRNTRKKLETIKNTESFSRKVESDSDMEKTAKASENDSQLSKSDVEEIINRKLDEDNMLLDSYEDYLRKLSKEEEDGPEDTNDDGSSSSDSDSDSVSSDSSFSISSLSDNDKEDSNDTDDSEQNRTGQDKTEKFQPLYSLPIKPKKTDNNAEESTCTVNGTKIPENNLDSSKKSFYATMDQNVLDPNSLRTQSAPDLRNTKLPRTLDTQGYMCPIRLPELDGKQSTLSSPELKQTTFNLKFRPLPSIPIDKTRSRKEREDSVYETIRTRDFSESIDSPTKSGKMSFKAVADRVVSLMPRLTTREARSREMDHYMADIIRYLPDKKLRIFVGTWNMKGIKVMPASLDDYLLPSESVFIQDIYAVGCQEGTPFRKEWEICLQETLGPTHVLMFSGNFGVLQLSIFVRRELVWFCTNIEQDTVATRIAHKIKTKGAIAVSFNVFGTSLLFINSHFASDQQKLKERIVDYRTICRSLSIPTGYEDPSNRQPDVTSRFDRVFWFGDFNFRVNKKRAETDQIFEETGFENEYKRTEYIVEELLPHDQLHALLRKGKIFHGFQESEIKFLPTYKFDVNTDRYDTSAKKRVQSWTDRVLYKSKQPDQIKVSMYNSCTTIKCSDHRPVFAIIEANIEPVKKNVLLPCAMFDREIYVEANMRRSAPKGNQQSSNVCVIL